MLQEGSWSFLPIRSSRNKSQKLDSFVQSELVSKTMNEAPAPHIDEEVVVVEVVEEVEEQEEERENEDSASGSEEGVGARGTRKRKAHQKKKRSIAHSLSAQNVKVRGDARCKLCEYYEKELHSSNMIRHWEKKHNKELVVAQAAEDKGQDVAAAVATIVESRMTSVGSLAKWVITKRRVQEGRWIKELGIIRYIVTQKISFLSIDSDEFSDMLSDFGQSIDAKATILKLIPPLYEFVLTKKCSRLHQCSALSFAADFWTSKAARKYMGLAYFGIDPSWLCKTK